MNKGDLTLWFSLHPGTLFYKVQSSLVTVSNCNVKFFTLVNFISVGQSGPAAAAAAAAACSHMAPARL